MANIVGEPAYPKAIINALRNNVTELRKENECLRELLREIANPPIVLESDNPIEVAAWFVNKAKEMSDEV